MNPSPSTAEIAFRALFRSLARVEVPSATDIVAELGLCEVVAIQRLAFVAARLWEPIRERLSEHELRAPEALVRRYAAAFLDRMGLTSPGQWNRWLDEIGLLREQIRSLFEHLYMYEQIVQHWNVHYIGATDIDLQQDWWARAFALWTAATGIEITDSWARAKRDAYWRAHLTEPSYFKFGFEGGGREFDALAKRIS